MERRVFIGFALWTLTLAGCGSGSSTESAATNAPSAATAASASPAGPVVVANPQAGDHQVSANDPAAVAAHSFLDAVVKGDTATASSLLTPLAIERINHSGKPFQLPGLANYTFQIVAVRKPVPDKAFVQCFGTDRSAGEQAVNEEFCWLMCLVEDQWRIAGISYSMGPNNQLMIYSFENPEKGAIPVQSLMPKQPASAAVGQTAGMANSPATDQVPGYQASGYQTPAQTPPDRYPTEPPRTAQEALPVGSYR